jgi:hypothetical protein
MAKPYSMDLRIIVHRLGTRRSFASIDRVMGSISNLWLPLPEHNRLFLVFGGDRVVHRVSMRLPNFKR